MLRADTKVSIHAPHVGRDETTPPSEPADAEVSIHVGRDDQSTTSKSTRRSFNPRAPRGARLKPAYEPIILAMFQSTRPTWGATRRGRPLCRVHDVSIHAPHVGRDAGGSSRPRAGRSAGHTAALQPL